MTGRLQVILSTIEPGGGTGAEPYAHDSDEEVVDRPAGQLELWVARRALPPRGGRLDHLFRRGCPHSERQQLAIGQAIVLFCLTPPSF